MTNRYKVFPATEHRKRSNRFEVWDTEAQQCKGEYIGKAAAETAASILNGETKLTIEPLTAPLQIANWDGRRKA